MSSAPNLDLLTIREAAELLDVSKVTVSRWVKEGRLPSYRVGPRAVRPRRDDVARQVAHDGGDLQSAGILRASRSWKPALPPLSDEEVAQALWVIEKSQRAGEDILATRGRQLMTPAEEIIREARNERVQPS